MGETLLTSPLSTIYTKRKDDIENALEQLKSSDVCRDYGNFASIRRGPMLTTVIYYLQHHLGYNGVSLEELKAFLYCMLLSEVDKYEKTVKSIAWCPIEQTLKQLSRNAIKLHDGRFVVDTRGISQGNLMYWDALKPVFVSAEKICNDILSPPNDIIEKLLASSIQSLQRNPEMEEYLHEIRYKRGANIHTSQQEQGGVREKLGNGSKIRIRSKYDLLEKFIKPEGITVREVLSSRPDPDALVDVEKAYERAWQREKLLYGDGYIKFLVSVAEYYIEKESEKASSDFQEFLNEIFGPNNLKKAAIYYVKAASIATSMSLLYFPRLNNPEEAERYLKLAVDLEEKAIKLGFTPEYHSITLSNLGTHYYETHRSREALKILKKALKYANTPDEKGLILHNLSLTYADLGMEKEAVESMVKSICIHYAVQHDFGDITLYDEDINRIIEMTGGLDTDVYALKIALDFIGGNLTKEEACWYLKGVSSEEWPLSRALQELLCKGIHLQEVSLTYGECKPLLESVEKTKNLQGDIQRNISGDPVK